MASVRPMHPLPTLAARIRRSARVSGHFVLRSGVVSDTYFDKYQFEADPVLLRVIAVELSRLVPDGTEVVAGLEMGGIPIVTMLSQVKKYRGRGVGGTMARAVFAALPGPWEVGQMPNNLPAQRFWRRVIAGYTGGRYVEHRLTGDWWEGFVQCFQTSGAQR